MDGEKIIDITTGDAEKLAEQIIMAAQSQDTKEPEVSITVGGMPVTLKFATQSDDSAMETTLRTLVESYQERVAGAEEDEGLLLG